jgi:hypothetical protein
MSMILSILGLVVIAAGSVAIGFGIPINEFNLGNTLIVSGTIAFAAGLILIGLAAAVDQLTQICNALRPRSGLRPAAQPQAAQPQAAEQALPAAIRPSPAPVQAPAPAKPPMPPPPPRGPIFAKPKPEDRVPEPAAEDPAPAVSSSAIERLRSSLMRPDRKVSDVEDAEEVPYSPGAQAVPAGPGPGANVAPNLGTNGAGPAGGAGAAEALKKPPLDFLFRSKGREPQPEAFDAVWPKRGQRRADERANAGEAARPAEAPLDRPSQSELPPAPAPDEVRPAAILKSGVVDGMAYTLYADGSIEAQLPQGTVRFGSIAELRSHIENNS